MGGEEQRAAREAQRLRSTLWMDSALAHSIGEALNTDWILDADTTIKLLYGHQDGAEVQDLPGSPISRPDAIGRTFFWCV